MVQMMLAVLIMTATEKSMADSLRDQLTSIELVSLSVTEAKMERWDESDHLTGELKMLAHQMVLKMTMKELMNLLKADDHLMVQLMSKKMAPRKMTE